MAVSTLSVYILDVSVIVLIDAVVGEVSVTVRQRLSGVGVPEVWSNFSGCHLLSNLLLLINITF